MKSSKSKKPKEDEHKVISPWIHFIAGGYDLHSYSRYQITDFRTGGTVAMTITCPLEVIKTRLQVKSICLLCNIFKASGHSSMDNHLMKYKFGQRTWFAGKYARSEICNGDLQWQIRRLTL
jgi:hypothetical protein